MAVSFTWMLACVCIAILPITAENGSSGFPDLDTIYTKASLIQGLVERNGEQRVFPGIYFSCNGSITKWIFLARDGRNLANKYPELQIWRTNGEQTYHKTEGVSVMNAEPKDSFVYEHSPSDPIPFRDGDVFGLYQPTTADSRLVLQHQAGGGRGVLRKMIPDPAVEIDMNNTNLSYQNDYPLVGIEASPMECVHGFLKEDAFTRIALIRSHEQEQRVIPSINFTCSGTVTRWTIGLQRRQLTSGVMPLYPQLQIWRGQSTVQLWDWRSITASELISTGDPNVYEFTPDSPLSFEAGDMLGLYQPAAAKTEVEIYYQFDGGPTNYVHVENEMAFQIDLSGTEADEDLPLVAVDIMTAEPGECAVGFIDLETLKRNAVLIENFVENYEEQQIFPSINFTVNGYLIKWLFAARDLGITPQRTRYPELRILRRVVDTSFYFPIHQTEMEPAQTGYLNVYEYIPDEPLPFEAGDILSVVQQNQSSSRLALSFISGAGPPDTITMPLQQSRQARSTGECDLPLVAAEISIANSITPTATSTSIQISAADTITTVPQIPVITSSKQLPVPPSTTQFPVRSSILDPPYAEGKSSSPFDSISMIIVGPVAGGVFLALVILMAIVIVCCIARWKRQSTRAKNNNSENIYDEVVNTRQPCVTELPPTQKNAAEIGARNSGNAYDHLTPSPKPCLIINNPEYYELKPLNAASRTGSYDTVYSESATDGMHYEWDTYVPTLEHRHGICNGEQLYGQLRLNSSLVNFFEESDSYWIPASNECEIYEQLSDKKYREILRPRVQISEELGSGQFGLVNKGVWQTAGGAVDVAVKTLKDDATDEDKIKFLQEAAINGQFRHPNIVRLLGVVTLGDPIMIVLELLTKGDLRTYVIDLRPSQDIVQEKLDLPPMLLSFCKDIASGMEYLSWKGFVHRDLAARNILLSGNTTCKIGDFGMSRDLEGEDYYISQQKGKIPVKWTAPEALHFRKYSTASDVWSYGVVMYEIWSLGHKPFEGYTNNVAIELLYGGFRLSPPPGCPKEIYKVMIDCWHPEKSSRPTFTDVLRVLSGQGTWLLKWSEEDKRVPHPQATVLGAPLAAGRKLYPDLQKTYVH